MRFAAVCLFAAASAFAGELQLERCVTAGRAPGDCRFVSVPLAESDRRELRELVVATRERQEREEEEARRDGRVTGGVWGFVNFGYRLTFEGTARWLHAIREAAWLDGAEETGNIVFDRDESARLWKILARLERSPAAIVARLPLDVTWTPSIALDLNCDSAIDQLFVARDSEHYYVAAVMAPFQESSVATYLRFRLGGQFQDSFCDEPQELEEEDSQEGCRGVRIRTGECDSFHLYWNVEAQALDWWRL